MALSAGGSRFLKSKKQEPDPFQSELSGKIRQRSMLSSGLYSDSDEEPGDLLSQYSKKPTANAVPGSKWEPGKPATKTDSSGLSQYMAKKSQEEKPQNTEPESPAPEELIFGKETMDQFKQREAKRTKVYQPPSFSRKWEEDDEEEEDKSGSLSSRNDPMLRTMKYPVDSKQDPFKEKRLESRDELRKSGDKDKDDLFGGRRVESRNQTTRRDRMDRDEQDEDDEDFLFGNNRRRVQDSKRIDDFKTAPKEREQAKPSDPKSRSFLKSSTKPKEVSRESSESPTPRAEKKSLMDFITGSNESKNAQPVLSRSEQEERARRGDQRGRRDRSEEDDWKPGRRGDNKEEEDRLRGNVRGGRLGVNKEEGHLRAEPKMQRPGKFQDSTDFDLPQKSADFRKTGASTSFDKSHPVPKQRFRKSSPDRGIEDSFQSRDREANSGRQSPDIILPGDKVRPPNLRDKNLDRKNLDWPSKKGNDDKLDEKDRPESPSSFCEELERDPRSLKEDQIKQRKEERRRKRELLTQTSQHQEDSNVIYQITDEQTKERSQSARDFDSGVENDKEKKKTLSTMTSSKLFSHVAPKIQTRPRTLRRSESLGDNMNYTDSTSIRDSVYEQWYIKRMQEGRRQKRELKQKEEEEKLKKQKEKESKEADRDLAFKSWSEAKKNFVPTSKIKEKEEQKRKEKEEKEKKEKEDDAKKAFEIWSEKKKENDKKLMATKRKQQQKENEEKSATERKKEDAKSAFESWNKNKTVSIITTSKTMRSQKEGEIEERKRLEKEKIDKSKEEYLKWEEKKRMADEAKREQQKKENPMESSLMYKKPWRPSSASGPKRVPMCS